MRSLVRRFCALPFLSLALANPAMATPATSPATDPASLFDTLFGDEPTDENGGNATHPGRDDGLILALYIGPHNIRDALAAFAQHDGPCLVVNDVLESLEIAHSEDSDAGDISIGLQAPNRSVRLPADALVATPAGRCLPMAQWARYLPLTLNEDTTNLRITIVPHESLPVMRRLDREERRRNLRPNRPEVPHVPTLANPTRWLTAPTMDVAARLEAGNAGLAAQVAIDASADALHMTARVRSTVTSSGNASIGGSLSRTSDDATLLGPLGARSIAIGDVVAPVQPLLAASLAGRGLTFSNRPAWRADIFDRIDLSGPLPAGWEAELYHEDRLIAVITRPDSQGNYRFVDVALVNGFNRYVVKLYGPHGEEDEREFVRVVGSELRQENEWTYNVGIVVSAPQGAGSNAGPVATGGEYARLAGFATVERGLSDSLTARADVWTDSKMFAGSGALHASLFGGTASLLAAHSSAGTALALSAARHLGGFDFVVTAADFGRRAGDFAPQDVRDLFRSFSIASRGAIAVGGRSLGVETKLAQSVDRNGIQSTDIDFSLGISLRNLRLSNRLAADWRSPARGHELPDCQCGLQFSGTLIASTSLQHWRLRATADYRFGQIGRIDRLQIAASRTSSSSTVAAEAGWEWTGRGLFLRISASREIDSFSLGVTGSVSATDWQMGLTLGFSIFRPRKGGYRLGRHGLADAAAIRPLLFIDEDGDGQMSVGDTPIPGGRFLVDNSLRSEMSGTDGASFISGIGAGRPVMIETQISSLPDLNLRPTQPGIRTVLRAGQVLDVPIAVHRTGEIEVRLLSRSGDIDSPLSGTTVVAESAGRRLATVSDFDGFAYFDGVPYGEWSVQVDGAITTDKVFVTVDKEHPSQVGQRLILADEVPAADPATRDMPSHAAP